jgi:hypothetical protein
MRITPPLVALLCAAGLAVEASAQSQPSLAEVAQKEAERRKTVKAPTKVYTNADLVKSGLLTTGAAAPAGASSPAASGQAGATTAPEGQPAPAAEAAAGGAEPPASAEPTKGEAYWRKRITDARSRLRENQVLADALQSRINALTTDFVNRDDPIQREAIAAQRREALAELDRKTRQIDEGRKAIADIEEEARRSGVPPGWLR